MLHIFRILRSFFRIILSRSFVRMISNRYFCPVRRSDCMLKASWRCFFILFLSLSGVATASYAQSGASGANENKGSPGSTSAQPAAVTSFEQTTEVNITDHSIFSRALQGGLVVFSCLLLLIAFSIMTWAVVVGKFVFLHKINKTNDAFIKSFWDSRSLNDLPPRHRAVPCAPSSSAPPRP